MNSSANDNERTPPQRILVRGVNWLGDAVMTTPALMRLRQRFPKAEVSLMAPEKLRELWLHHPAVDRVLSFASSESVWNVSRRLRSERFDLALVLPNSPRSALEVWLARIPRRIGHARPWRNWFLTDAVPSHPAATKMRKRTADEVRVLIGSHPNGSRPAAGEVRHQIHDYLHLTGALGASQEPLPPLIAVTDAESESVKAKFGFGPTRPLFALNAGAEYGPAKRWPSERFIAAAKQISKQSGCQWLVLGGAADRDLAGGIFSALTAAGCPADLLAGKTSLRELCAVLKLSRVLLTNDTGPMHLAAALGTPVVVPFGSTSPELTGPGLPGDPRHRLILGQAPCAPCFLRDCPIDFRCMMSIDADRVADAVIAAAGRSGGEV